MTTVSQVLNDAGDHVAVFGHCKGTGYTDPTNRLTSPSCIVGAIHAVVDDHKVRVLAVRAMDRYIGRPNVAVAFNDHPDTTPELVIETFRAAAVIEESREAQSIIAAANALDAPVVVGARA